MRKNLSQFSRHFFLISTFCSCLQAEVIRVLVCLLSSEAGCLVVLATKCNSMLYVSGIGTTPPLQSTPSYVKNIYFRLPLPLRLRTGIRQKAYTYSSVAQTGLDESWEVVPRTGWRDLSWTGGFLLNLGNMDTKAVTALSSPWACRVPRAECSPFPQASLQCISRTLSNGFQLSSACSSLRLGWVNFS